MRQLEMSGRLLPAPERPAMPSTSAVGHLAAEPELQADASSVDIDGVDVDAAHSGILGGELL